MKRELQVNRPQAKLIESSGEPRVLREAICGEVRERCSQHFASSLRAIVLTGSLARNEATFITQEGRSKLLGDAEFFLVFDEAIPRPSSSCLEGLRQRIEAALLGKALHAHVELHAVHPAYLRKLRPHILAYELRVCGHMIWGVSDILTLIPAFPPAAIPLEDAWRMLCNRMIEHLEVVSEFADRPETLPMETFYRTVKLYLDMATSYLLFVGAYEPTYQRRAARLIGLAASEQGQDRCPFPLAQFAERVWACTQVKLNRTDGPSLSASNSAKEWGFSFWEEAIEHARLLWRWELGILTGTQVQNLNGKLLQEWMRRQPLDQRLRGWLHVLRQEGWHRSWRNWPRWAWRAVQASPRYWTYAAASEIFFRLPCLLKAPGERPQITADWHKVRSWLPVTREATLNRRPANWQQLAADVAWNYQRFLVGTRS